MADPGLEAWSIYWQMFTYKWLSPPLGSGSTLPPSKSYYTQECVPSLNTSETSSPMCTKETVAYSPFCPRLGVSQLQQLCQIPSFYRQLLVSSIIEHEENKIFFFSSGGTGGKASLSLSFSALQCHRSPNSGKISPAGRRICSLPPARNFPCV